MADRKLLLPLTAAAGLAIAAPAAAEAPQGRGPEIHLYSAFGTPTRFAVRGRVLKKSGETAPSSTAVSKNVRRLLRNAEWKHVGIRVRVGEQALDAKTDEEGLFEVPFELEPPGLAPGLHALRVEVPGKLAQEGWLRIVPPGGTLVVSDFDDTVVVSQVTDKVKMLEIALTQTEDTQVAAPGMAELYRCLQGRGEGAPVFVYLSGSPVQFQPRIKAFLEKNGYPDGQMLLRKLGPRNLDGFDFKSPWIERLLADFPDNRFLFVGDSGEKDPEVYREAVKRAGPRAAGVLIRLVTDEKADSPRFEGMKAFRDPAEAIEALQAKGLLEPCSPTSASDPAQGAPAPEPVPVPVPAGSRATGSE